MVFRGQTSLEGRNSLREIETDFNRTCVYVSEQLPILLNGFIPGA